MKAKLAATALAVLAAVIWAYPTPGDYRADNPWWNGYSKLIKALNATPIHSLSEVEEPPEATALILIPYKPLSQQELADLSEYIRRGGLLVLMDDYGYGNQVLTSLKARAQLSQAPLLDPLFNYKNKRLPKAKAKWNLELYLNHPTAIIGEVKEVIAETSSFSYLDLNLNEAYDSEPQGPHTIAAIVETEAGDIAVIADPSIAINSMLDMGGNMQLLKQATGAGERRVYLDQAHLPSEPLDLGKQALRAAHKALSRPLPALLLAVAAIALAARGE